MKKPKASLDDFLTKCKLEEEAAVLKSAKEGINVNVGTSDSIKVINDNQLTKREQFVLAIINGRISNGTTMSKFLYEKEYRDTTYELADLLLKELSEKK